MNAKDALAQALVWFVEGRPIVQAVSRGHNADGDDWVIVEKVDGKLRQIAEPVAEAE